MKSLPARIRVAQALKTSGPDLEDRSQQGKSHDEKGIKKFQNSIALAKLDAMGDLVITMIEDVREAMKNADPAQGLQGLEKTFKNILNAIKEHASSLKGKADAEQRQMAAAVIASTIRVAGIEKLQSQTWDWTKKAMDEMDKLREEANKVAKAEPVLKDKIAARQIEKRATAGRLTIAHIFGDSAEATKEAAVKVAISLSDADKKVLDAFTSEKPADSKKLRSDGKKLDGLWMGGSNIAEWVDGKIRFNDLGSKAAQQVQQAIRKLAPKNDLEETKGKSVLTEDHLKRLYDVWNINPKSAPKNKSVLTEDHLKRLYDVWNINPKSGSGIDLEETDKTARAQRRTKFMARLKSAKSSTLPGMSSMTLADAEMNATTTVHVTRITANNGVYGHDCSGVDPADSCGGFDECFYSSVSGEGLEVGHVYEVDASGNVVAEVY